MADSSKLQPQVPVPKPRPRRARSGMIASATGSQQQMASAESAERRRGASESDVPVSDSLPGVEDSISTGRAWTDKVVSGITEEDLYSDTQLHHLASCDGGPPSTSSDRSTNHHFHQQQQQLQSLTERVASLRVEEAEVQGRVREWRWECGEMEKRVREVRSEEVRLRGALEQREREAIAHLREVLSDLEMKVEGLREEEGRLRVACQERERQRAALEADTLTSDPLRERELELQRRLSETSDRDYRAALE